MKRPSGARFCPLILSTSIPTRARIDSPLLTHTLFGIYIGIMMGGGIYLRDPELRSIFPCRR